jgi:sporulation protein YlmC with PRC-barrel domain
MLYLSQLLGAPVEDSEGARVGKIVDILIAQDEPAPQTILLIEGQEDRRWYVPAEVAEWRGNVLRLPADAEQLATQPVTSSSHLVSLAQDVLDKQVIDLARKKAVRVNDICFDDQWHNPGIDNSSLGLVRRLAPPWLPGVNSRRTPTSLIPWNGVELIGTPPPEEDVPEKPDKEEPLPGDLPEGLTGPSRPASGQLAELHPADIADIVHQLTPGQGARLIEGLDVETAADALQEIDTERQSHILENISADRAADILQAMEPDEAADLLAILPEERTRELLQLMTPEESEDVQDLLEYEKDSAGGLMTTNFIALDVNKTVAEAIDAVRVYMSEQDVRAAYVYCVADETQDECSLLGSVSLWDLLISDPMLSLKELMETDTITVQPDTDPRTVAEIMAKYNLLAVPVVSPEGILEGVVTVDDALDVLLPDERRRKPTRMY